MAGAAGRSTMVVSPFPFPARTVARLSPAPPPAPRALRAQPLSPPLRRTYVSTPSPRAPPPPVSRSPWAALALALAARPSLPRPACPADASAPMVVKHPRLRSASSRAIFAGTSCTALQGEEVAEIGVGAGIPGGVPRRAFPRIIPRLTIRCYLPAPIFFPLLSF